MNYVADTSVILAVILGEQKKKSILSATKGVTLIGPASIPWEIGNAFSALIKRNKISLAEAHKGIGVFQQIPIRILDVDFTNALTLSDEFNIYAYDAYFLDCCLRHAVPLITLDNEQKKIAIKLGIEILEV